MADPLTAAKNENAQAENNEQVLAQGEPSPQHAGGDPSEKKDEEVSSPASAESEGALLLWSGRFKEAEEAFRKEPKGLRTDLRLAEVAFFRAVVTGDGRLVTAAISALEGVEAAAHKTAKETEVGLLARGKSLLGLGGPSDGNEAGRAGLHWTATAVRAQALLLMGIMHAAGREFVRGPLSFRACYKLLSSLPDNKDPEVTSTKQLGFGAMKLFLSLAPPAARVAFNVMLLTTASADKEAGYAMLEQCANGGSAQAQLASVLLAVYFIILASMQTTQEKDKATHLSAAQRLVAPNQQTSDGILPLWLGAHIARRSGDYPAAVVNLEKVVQAAVRELELGDEVVVFRPRFDLGTCLCAMMKLEEALQYLTPLVGDKSTYTAKAMASMFAAGAHAAMGTVAGVSQARELLLSVIHLPNKGRVDTELSTKAQAVLKREADGVSLLLVEVLYLMGHLNALSREWLDEIDSVLQPLANKAVGAWEKRKEGNSPDDQPLWEGYLTALLLRAALCRLKGDLQQSATLSDTVLQETSQADYQNLVDRFHRPFAQYEKALVLVRQSPSAEANEAHNALQQAIGLLKAAEATQGFTFDRSLRYRVRSVLEDAQRRVK